MIQFNLLPDVKLQYIKARRQKRFIGLISAVLAVGALGVFVLLLLYVHIAQAKHISDLTADIKTNSQELEGTKDLDKILTVQNQLRSLPELHDKKPVVSRLFGYLSQLTPSTVTITQLDVDYQASSIKLSGESTGLDTVNKFVDTLKFTNYKTVSDGDTTTRAFSDVVLSSFSRSDKTTYSIDAKFDPIIFDSKETVTLVVPNIITTRAQDGTATAIFQDQTGN